MKAYPLEDRVLARQKDADDTTASGLVIPDIAKERPQQGEVLAVGPGKRTEHTTIPMDIQEGDIIVFSRYAGTEIELNGEDLLIISSRDILAVLEDEE